jgi:hypothetical protein
MSSETQQLCQDIGKEALAICGRTAPGGLMAYFTLNHVVALLTAVFLMVQIVWFVVKARWAYVDRQSAKRLQGGVNQHGAVS